MISTESVDLGKKIFFLNPPYDFKKLIIPMLSDLEYEIYILSDYKYAKEALRNNPDSICFVCIDGEISIEHWYNFVVSFNNDPSLSSIFLGVMSAYAGASDRNHFLLNASIPAGFISLAAKKDELVNKLVGILKINNAKGVRKYVRADCATDELISVHCEVNDAIFPLHIDNISSAGLLCSASPKIAASFSPNMLLKEFFLILRKQKIKCHTVVLKTFISNEKLFIVLLFTKGLSYNSKAIIQSYIRYFLQTTLDQTLTDAKPDDTDYSKLQTAAIGAEGEDAFLISVDEEEVIFADEIEEVTYADEYDKNETSEKTSPLFGNDDEESFLNQMKYLEESDIDGDIQLIDDTE